LDACSCCCKHLYQQRQTRQRPPFITPHPTCAPAPPSAALTAPAAAAASQQARQCLQGHPGRAQVPAACRGAAGSKPACSAPHSATAAGQHSRTQRRQGE
jgi:hypothetical protein